MFLQNTHSTVVILIFYVIIIRDCTHTCKSILIFSPIQRGSIPLYELNIKNCERSCFIMSRKRLENFQDGQYRRRRPGIFMSIGLSGIRVIAAVLLGIIKGIKFIISELASLIRGIFRGFLWLVRFVVDPFRRRMKATADMQQALRQAKKHGRKAYIRELIKCTGSFLFGEEGMCYTAFNYILPIVSIAFFIGVIRYSSGLRYGICVEYNGKEIGIISAEADFDSAARVVQQRISYTSNDETLDFSPRFSLRIISNDEKFVNSTQLANEMLAVSDHELTNAYGIYIDNKFIGAVQDKTPVDEALTKMILDYEADGVVRDVSFQNKIDYTEGLYLADSVMTEEDAIALLTSKDISFVSYKAQAGDSPIAICQKYNMKLEDFHTLNPNVGDSIKPGSVLTVMKTENYLPIQYIREIETHSFLDYETIEVETSSLNVGTAALLVKGEKGERRNKIEITYVDGIERARKTVTSVVTKQPVVEQIGIGTYTAKPASSSTMLTGTGQFGWPVDGGYISDPFLSDRNHKGLDIAAPGGSDIYAAADGVVVSAGWNAGGYGFFVMIDHLDGFQTVYGHCSAVFATEGQTVTRGQLIAAVGTTGDSTGNHCHFEVRNLGMCYDPALFINTVESFGDDEE